MFYNPYTKKNVSNFNNIRDIVSEFTVDKIYFPMFEFKLKLKTNERILYVLYSHLLTIMLLCQSERNV